MTKAFLVYIKPQNTNTPISPFVWSSPQITTYPSVYTAIDNRPILVIAKTIDEAAKKFKNATSIEEVDVKDIIIDENIDILLERR
jgi:hypothetical protein